MQAMIQQHDPGKRLPAIAHLQFDYRASRFQFDRIRGLPGKRSAASTPAASPAPNGAAAVSLSDDASVNKSNG